ncbi:hypothetical protein MHK_001484 [Candidatus Magnetomorum sp. HK-1]|nr:hypothetical protein MHK_001484 [Candidatus Magnetomorum sp. HK-1]
MNTKFYKLNINLDGIAKNNGAVAEEFFFNGLKDKMEIEKLKFETIDSIYGDVVDKAYKIMCYVKLLYSFSFN